MFGMPEGISKPAYQEIESPRLLTPEELAAKKQEMFDHILQSYPKLQHLRLSLIEMVAEHSIDDALVLLEEERKVHGFHKHRDFFYTILCTGAIKHHKVLFDKLKNRASELLDEFGHDVTELGTPGLNAICGTVDRVKNIVFSQRSSDEQEYFEKHISPYYSELLRQKKIKHIETEMPKMTGEAEQTDAQEKAIELLEQMYQMSQGKQRPLDVVFDIKKKSAEKGLKSEIAEAMEKEVYSDVEVFWDEESEEYKVKGRKVGSEKLEVGRKEEKKEGKVDWEKEPKMEVWPGITRKILFKRDDKPSLRMRDQQIVDFINSKEYTVIDNEVLSRKFAMNIYEWVYSPKKGEKISHLTLVGGKPAYVVEDTNGKFNKVMVGDKEIASGSEYKYERLFDLRGKVVISGVNHLSRALSFPFGDGLIYFDPTPESVIDVQPYGTDDFVAVGYLDGKPVAYTKDKKYDLEPNIGKIKKLETSGIPKVLFEHGYQLLDGNLGSNDCCDFFENGSVQTNVDNAYTVWMNGKKLCRIPQSDWEYHSIKVIDGIPFVTLMPRGLGTYFVTRLNTDDGAKSFAKKPSLSFDGEPQIIEQNDKVVFAGMQNGVFKTFEWTRPSSAASEVDGQEAKKEEKGEGEILDWSDLTQINQQVGIDIAVLELIKKPDAEKISFYLNNLGRNQNLKEKAKNILSRNPYIAKMMTGMLQQKPEMFLDTMTAVPDKTDRIYVDYLLGLLVPELHQAKMRERNSLGNSLYSTRAYERESALSHLVSNEYSEIAGGDPTHGFDKEIFRVNDNSGEIYATGIYWKYNHDSGRFSKMPINYDNTRVGSATEITAEIPIPSNMAHTINLPRRIGANVIRERAKIIYTDGKEEKIDIKINEYGEDTARVVWKPGMKSLVYSQEVPDAPYIPSDITAVEYQRETEGMDKEPIVELAPEDEYFVKSLEKMTPREKLYAIEYYVQTNSYYDFKNGEVMREKMGLKPDELVSFMQIRAKELGHDTKMNKRYAGVCDDFKLITTALMRRAGLASGAIDGSRPKNGVATIGDAHGMSGALWPTEKGFKVVPIDGTPSEGATPEETEMLKEIRFATLAEREKRVVELEKVEAGEVLKMLDEIEEKLGGENGDKLEGLINGELEKMLNVVLKHQVKSEHVAVIDRLFGAARFAGIPVFSDDLEDQAKVRKYIESEVRSENTRRKRQSERVFAGTDLFDIFHKFLEKQGGDMNKVDTVIRIMEPSLGKVEKRALKLLSRYLKAEKMKRSG